MKDNINTAGPRSVDLLQKAQEVLKDVQQNLDPALNSAAQQGNFISKSLNETESKIDSIHKWVID